MPGRDRRLFADERATSASNPPEPEGDDALMSPGIAWHDAVFRAYIEILLGLLVVAGVVLTVLQLAFRIELKAVWKTYCAWLWMGPLAALMIFAGRVPFIIGVVGVALLAFREFASVSELRRDRWLIATVAFGIIGVAVNAWRNTGLLFVVVGTVILIALVPIARNRVRGGLEQISLGVTAFVFLGILFGQLGFLANTANPYGYLCFLVLATEVNDVAAFTFGRIFGRHPLRSAISPRKTREGSLGAFAFSMILPWLVWFSFPNFSARELLLTGLIVGVGGQIGDLTLSLMKRELGAKDWGNAIPGHGGVLDRIDSLIFVAPLFALLVGVR
jgi:phosphatidate cytidylyltransferase